MVTFIPYIAIEVPSNMVFKKIGPRWMLSGLCICWGVVTAFECLIQNYAGFIACRFFIGLFEGGVFPGFVLYLSDFYRRDEIQSRIGLLYGAASIAGAFSGLLAAAIEKMDGIAGLAGWRWIFLLEGLATAIFGLFALWALPNTPRDVITFTAEQKEYYVRRIAADAKTKVDHSTVALKDIVACLCEPHFLNIGIMSVCIGFVAQGVAYFTPSVVLGFGFGPRTSQLLTVPPFMFAFIVTMTAGMVADRHHRRGLVTIATSSLGILGCILNHTGTSLGIRYSSLFFLVAGIYSCAPTLLAWIPNNNAAYGKRASAIAIGFVISNAGGMGGVWLYPSKDAPRYLFATNFQISFLATIVVLSVVQVFILRQLNRQKVSRRDDLLQGLEHLSLDEQMQELGDHHPDFKYTL